MGTTKSNSKDAVETTPPAHTPGDQRREWTPPTSERRGSVAELVQITKISGHTDTGNTKRNR